MKSITICTGDTCPECNMASLEFEPAEPQTRDEPGQPDCLFCPDCGFSTTEIDWRRMEHRKLAESMAQQLFSGGAALTADRLVFEREGKPQTAGWSKPVVVELLAKMLDDPREGLPFLPS